MPEQKKSGNLLNAPCTLYTDRSGNTKKILRLPSLGASCLQWLLHYFTC